MRVSRRPGSAASLEPVTFRDPEIENLDAIGAVGLLDQHDVVRLQVSVNDADVVRGIERGRDLACNGEPRDPPRAATRRGASGGSVRRRTRARR